MARKRKRGRLRPKPFLVIGLVGNITAGLLWSPLTSVTKVRVEGAQEADKARLEKIVQGMHDIPCAQIHPRLVESAALELPAMRSATLNRNLFGSAVLSVGYRRPVARVQAAARLGLSIDGVVFPSLEPLSPSLPVVVLPAGRPGVLTTVASTWESAKIANLAVRLQETYPQSLLRIGVVDSGFVWLNMGSGRVALGDCDQLDAKLEILKNYLNRDPSFLSKIEVLNLTSPKSPSATPRKAATP